MKKAWRVDGAGMGEAGVRLYWWRKENAQKYAAPSGKSVERVLVAGDTKHIK